MCYRLFSKCFNVVLAVSLSSPQKTDREANTLLASGPLKNLGETPDISEPLDLTTLDGCYTLRLQTAANAGFRLLAISVRNLYNKYPISGL